MKGYVSGVKLHCTYDLHPPTYVCICQMTLVLLGVINDTGGARVASMLYVTAYRILRGSQSIIEHNSKLVAGLDAPTCLCTIEILQCSLVVALREVVLTKRELCFCITWRERERLKTTQSYSCG